MVKTEKKIDLCSIIKSNYEDVAEKYFASDLKIHTLAVDDTDVLVHCTSKEQADNIEKEGILKGNWFHGVSFTNKTGGFKGHICNSGADVCFVFSKKDIPDVEPVIYDWYYEHVYSAINLLKGKCPADGWNRPEECESAKYHIEKGCSPSMTDKEAKQYEKSKRRKKGTLHQSALFVYENEFRSKLSTVKLPTKYLRIPNSCKLETPRFQ